MTSKTCWPPPRTTPTSRLHTASTTSSVRGRRSVRRSRIATVSTAASPRSPIVGGLTAWSNTLHQSEGPAGTPKNQTITVDAKTGRVIDNESGQTAQARATGESVVRRRGAEVAARSTTTRTSSSTRSAGANTWRQGRRDRRPLEGRREERRPAQLLDALFLAPDKSIVSTCTMEGPKRPRTHGRFSTTEAYALGQGPERPAAAGRAGACPGAGPRCRPRAGEPGRRGDAAAGPGRSPTASTPSGIPPGSSVNNARARPSSGSGRTTPAGQRLASWLQAAYDEVENCRSRPGPGRREDQAAGIDHARGGSSPRIRRPGSRWLPTAGQPAERRPDPRPGARSRTTPTSGPGQEPHRRPADDRRRQDHARLEGRPEDRDRHRLHRVARLPRRQRRRLVPHVRQGRQYDYSRSGVPADGKFGDRLRVGTGPRRESRRSSWTCRRPGRSRR